MVFRFNFQLDEANLTRCVGVNFVDIVRHFEAGDCRPVWLQESINEMSLQRGQRGRRLIPLLVGGGFLA